MSTICAVGQSVFYDTAPVASERFPTAAELAEFRRRAKRDWAAFAPYLLVSVSVIVAVVLVAWMQWFAPGVRALLGIAAAATCGVVLLRNRDLIVESRSLRGVDATSKIYKFSAGGMRPLSLYSYLSPAHEYEVLYPQRLVIASGYGLWKRFKPVKLVIFEDLPWPERAQEVRPLTELEHEEVRRQCKRHRNLAWEGLATFLLCGGMVFRYVWRKEFADWPFVLIVALAFCAVLGLIQVFYNLGTQSDLKESLASGEAAIEWDAEFFREYLLPGRRLLWRDEDGPASWRRKTSGLWR